MTEENRNQQLKRFTLVVRDLLQGKEHDRRSIAKAATVTLATADRYLEVLRTLPGIKTSRHKRRVFVRLSRPENPPSLASAIAAAMCGGLATIFEGTNYAAGIRDAVSYL